MPHSMAKKNFFNKRARHWMDGRSWTSQQACEGPGKKPHTDSLPGSMMFLSFYVKAYPPGNQKSSSEKRLMNGETDEPHPTMAYHLPKEMAERVAREAANWDLQLDGVKLIAP